MTDEELDRSMARRERLRKWADAAIIVLTIALCAWALAAFLSLAHADPFSPMTWTMPATVRQVRIYQVTDSGHTLTALTWGTRPAAEYCKQTGTGWLCWWAGADTLATYLIRTYDDAGNRVESDGWDVIRCDTRRSVEAQTGEPAWSCRYERE